MASWREAAAPIIARVIASNKGVDRPTLRKALHDAFPWGPRRYHPYQIWQDEIARQLGRKPKLGTRTTNSVPTRPDPRQQAMFDAFVREFYS